MDTKKSTCIYGLLISICCSDVNGPDLVQWPKYTVVKKKYALLDVNVTIQSNLYKERMDFWLNERYMEQSSHKPCTSLQCIFG